MRTIASLSGFLFAGLLIAAQEPVKPDRVVDRRAELHPGQTIEGLGACNATAESVSCWDMDGRPNADLSERLKAQLLAGYSEMSFRFGKKNRVLAIRRTPGSFQAQMMSVHGGYLNTIPSYYNQGEPVIDWVRVTAENDERDYSVVANIYSWSREEGDIPFRQGEKRKIGGVDYELSSWDPVKFDPRSPGDIAYFNGGLPPQNQKGWQMILSVNGTSTGGTAFSVRDKQDHPIRYVNSNGEPVADAVVLRSQPLRGSFNPMPINGKYRAVTVSPAGSGTPSAARYYLNVDPKFIGSLHVEVNSSLRVQINGFPLEPKG